LAACRHTMAVAEPDPLIVIGGQLQVGTKCRDPDRE
jgi:hypothetical protein